MPPSADMIRRQVDWEVEGFTRASQAYQEANAHKSLADCKPGQVLLREVVPSLTEAIEEAQGEALETIKSPGRRGIEPLLALRSLDAEKLAVITLSLALRAFDQAPDASAQARGSITSISLKLAASIRDQIEHDRWVSEHAHGEPEDKRLLDALRRRYPVIDRHVWSRWRRKVQALREEPWPKSVSLAVGTQLLSLLLKAAPDRFSLVSRPLTGGRTVLAIELSASTLETIRDIHTRAEIARPVHLPMLIPPNPWRYEPAAERAH